MWKSQVLVRGFSYNLNVLTKMTNYTKARRLRSEIELNMAKTDKFEEYIKTVYQAGQHKLAYTEYLRLRNQISPEQSSKAEEFIKSAYFEQENVEISPKSGLAYWLSRLSFSTWMFGFWALWVIWSRYEKAQEEKIAQDASSRKGGAQTESKKSTIKSPLDNAAMKTKFMPERNIKERFKDVVGIDEFRAELEEIVDFLKSPQKYSAAGATFPKGVLLSGPPGTGKTLIARAVAGEANCSFFYASASQFDNMFRGSGKDNVKALFEAARKHKPAIVFVDEIDSVAGDRKRISGSTNTINQLLTELDGFHKTEDIIFMCATNLEDSIDPAVTRSGRIDKVIRIPLPDVAGRERLLRYYIDRIKSEKVDLNMMARHIIGFSGADIKNYVNTAIIHAVKKGRKAASNQDYDFAYDRIQMGVRRKNPLLNDEKKRETAIRMIGMALAAYYTPGSNKFYKVTILPTGQSLGHVSLNPNKDELSMSRENILAQMDIFMAGKAAEQVYYGANYSTSACAQEIEKATNLAYYYIRDMGMIQKKLFINSDTQNLSQAYRFKVDTAVQEQLTESLTRVKSLIINRRKEMDKLVEVLLKNESLSYQEFDKLIQ
jgi:ATP-dependent metalloprotease